MKYIVLYSLALFLMNLPESRRTGLNLDTILNRLISKKLNQVTAKIIPITA